MGAALSLFVAEAAQASHRQDVRFASFNASLNRFLEGELISDLSTPEDAQAQVIAEILQRSRPDVVLVNEFTSSGLTS